MDKITKLDIKKLNKIKADQQEELSAKRRDKICDLKYKLGVALKTIKEQKAEIKRLGGQNG